MRLAKTVVLYMILPIVLLQSYPHNVWGKSIYNKQHVNIHIVDKIYKEKNQYLNIDVIVPFIAEDIHNNEESKFNSEIILYTERWINEVKNEIKDLFSNGIPPTNPYELYARYTVTNLKDIISLYIDYYQYTGGAHGITIRKAYNIDSNFKKMSIQDLFKKDYNYKSVIDKEIRDKIAKEPEKYFNDKEGFKGIDENTKFYIKDKYLVIYYNQYEIAPYASGIPEFYINKEIFQDNFKYN